MQVSALCRAGQARDADTTGAVPALQEPPARHRKALARHAACPFLSESKISLCSHHPHTHIFPQRKQPASIFQAPLRKTHDGSKAQLLCEVATLPDGTLKPRDIPRRADPPKQNTAGGKGKHKMPNFPLRNPDFIASWGHRNWRAIGRTPPGGL